VESVKPDCIDRGELERIVENCFGASKLENTDEQPSHKNLLLKLQTLYDELLTNSCFQALLEQVVARPRQDNQPWAWQSILEQESLVVGLMTIEKSTSIPLHDHPGYHGMQRVLYGDVRLRQFDIAQQTQEMSDVVKLELFRDQVLETGEQAIYGPAAGNIHGFLAQDCRCVLLNVSFPANDKKPRSLYFLHNSVGSTHYANRVAKEVLNFSKVRKVA
jgi:hypothetical protein